MYRVGLPGWKFLGRLGVPLLVRVDVRYDEDAHSYWAVSHDLDGLAVCGNTLDELKAEVIAACVELLELALDRPPAHAIARMTYEPALGVA
jgi:hypothetical protein